jgi:glutamyl-Q tRNA(Asp) synthetase
VVVDDALQGVTDVVRGADLLDNTPWQIELQRALSLPTPAYTHLPLVVEPQGEKLSKSRRSLALEAGKAGSQLYQALTLLQQTPPPTLKLQTPGVILDWARANWELDPFQRLQRVIIGDPPGAAA